MTKSVRSLCDSIGGRKFVLTIGSGAVCTLLVWFEKITSGDFALVVIATVAAFITGNTYEATKGTKRESSTD